MANPLLGQVLGSVFANAMRGRARTGPFGAGPPAGHRRRHWAASSAECWAGAARSRAGRGAWPATTACCWRCCCPMRCSGCSATAASARCWSGSGKRAWASTRTRGYPRAATTSCAPRKPTKWWAARNSRASRTSWACPNARSRGGFAEIVPELVDQLIARRRGAAGSRRSPGRRPLGTRKGTEPADAGRARLATRARYLSALKRMRCGRAPSSPRRFFLSASYSW